MAKEHRQACARGEAQGCFDLASCLSTEHVGCERDLSRAATLYDQVCHNTAPDDHAMGAPWGTVMAQESCVFLGEAHEFGRGVPQDIERARQLYTTACEQPRGTGCLELAHLRFRQREPHADILPTALRGCDVHDDAESCLFAACLTLRPTFDPEVERLFDKACDAHHSPISTSCTIVDEVARCSNYFAMVRQGAP